MSSIGIFFGSTDGNTARVAESIAAALRARFQPAAHRADAAADSQLEAQLLDVELLDIAEFYVEDMADFDCLVVGIPTWNHGQLQADWEAAFPEFDKLDLRGKRAAVFGLGDQRGYPDTFGDAVFFMADRLRQCGATLVGAWPCDGYDFTGSWAVEDGRFLGLLLDEVNQPELTAPRIARWIDILGAEFGLTPVDPSRAPSEDSGMNLG